MTEFLRMSGIYWGVTAIDLLERLEDFNKDELITFVKQCQCSVAGGISPCEGHDPHLLYTLSAVQVQYMGFSLIYRCTIYILILDTMHIRCT